MMMKGEKKKKIKDAKICGINGSVRRLWTLMIKA